MDNQLLNDTLHILRKEADIDVFYYIIKENTLYILDNELHKYESTFEENIVLFHPSDRIAYMKNFNQVVSGYIPSFNGLYRKKESETDIDYHLYYISNVGHTNEDDEIDYVFYSMKDVTYISNKSDESERLKAAFLANISHEIRTPLNAITGFSDLLINCDDDAKKKMYSKIIRNNTDSLLKLIDGILDLSKLESGVVELENKTIEIDSLVKEIFHSYQHKMNGEMNIKFEIECGDPCVTISDEEKIREVLNNLLNNAMKYTSKGKILLKYTFDGENAFIAVSDTGIGIKPQCVDKVFNRFEKLGSLVPGTGLGLTLCKNIMNILDGEIGVESKYGEGSTFWIKLPAQPLESNNATLLKHCNM